MTQPSTVTCDPQPSPLRPVINRSRCEGKEDCLRVCPYNVFEIQRVTEEEKAALKVFARLKLFAHGGKQAYAVRADACHACGLCVSACPEKAITLRRVG